MAAIIVIALIGAFSTATLVRLAPGFDVDERQLDTRLNHESIEAARVPREQNRNILAFYAAYLVAMTRGDLGHSQTLNRPVRELIAERLPASIKLIVLGLISGWILALACAFSAALFRATGCELAAIAAAGALVCIPSAVLALASVYLRAPAFLAIALVVFPRIFSIAHNLLIRNHASQHIVTARAKGISEARVLLWHVLPVAGGQLIALAGVSVSIALAAAVPVEALAGIPGIGQLAWQAALGRDLPLLVTLTTLVCVATLAANATADLINEALRPQQT